MLPFCGRFAISLSHMFSGKGVSVGLCVNYVCVCVCVCVFWRRKREAMGKLFTSVFIEATEYEVMVERSLS